MANSEDIQAAITQMAIPAAMAPIRVIREANQPTEPHTRRSSPEELNRPRQVGPTDSASI